jgi:photosystem II stability/assembly factor-like uncharacterized protein
MAKDFTILVGTIGDGMWRSSDGGETFVRPQGLNSVDMLVKGFAVDPFDPLHVVAGMGLVATPYSRFVATPFPLHQSFDGGASWEPIESFEPKVEVWRITFDPATPGRYFVGTRPAAIHRTKDGGASFDQVPVATSDYCRGIGLTRITSITLHPDDPDTIFATVEIGGVRRSLDGGDTWDEVMTDLRAPVPNGAVYGEEGRADCHYSRISVGDPDLVLVSTPDGLYASDDVGTTWVDYPLKQIFPSQYHRDIAVKLDDPDTIFVGVGDDVGGSDGAVLVTRDRGATWEAADLPDVCNSPVWCFAQHPSDPDVVLACTHQGMLFGSEDGGRSWAKYQREFTEVRQMCWLPF